MKIMDNISLIIMLRSLFIFNLIHSGWTIRLYKGSKNTYQMYKNIKTNNFNSQNR